eukprot:symbB.v1.2.024106.t1/scaffold2259.1/size84200/2
MESLGQAIFSVGELMTKVIGPYLLLHFFLLPLPLLLLGPSFFWHGVANLFLAELVANIHGFIVTTFNHTGEDVYCFPSGCRVNSPTFYLRAVIGSANCSTGGFLNDFLHGYLNYQIEHHIWPDLSMLSYAKAQPHVKAICEKHGVPYVQENIIARMTKVFRIFTGHARMRRFPEQMVRKEDLIAWDDRGGVLRDQRSSQDLAPAFPSSRRMPAQRSQILGKNQKAGSTATSKSGSPKAAPKRTGTSSLSSVGRPMSVSSR